MPLINFKRLNNEARIPSYGSKKAAGFDLFALDTVVIPPGEMVKVPLGFSTAIEPGYWVDIRPRSGHALKGRITVQNSPGTVDEDYRGEWIVLLENEGLVPYTIEKGKACAQGVVFTRCEGYFNEVQSLDETTRGTGGFGSTDRKA